MLDDRGRNAVLGILEGTSVTKELLSRGNGPLRASKNFLRSTDAHLPPYILYRSVDTASSGGPDLRPFTKSKYDFTLPPEGYLPSEAFGKCQEIAVVRVPATHISHCPTSERTGNARRTWDF